MNQNTLRHPLVICGLLWCALLATIILTRPLMNTIETRAMTVAWEMHVRHDFLVPTLNFAAYTQKPPLLAWLINAGWLMFGIHNWIATLIMGLFGFGCIAWTAAIAKHLWPDNTDRVRQTTWLCLGSVVLQVFGTLIFYDMMLTFFALGGIYMILRTLETPHFKYFCGLAICMALAGLTKGPVILLHIVPLILLAPFWSTHKPINWRTWYAKITISILLGAALAFAWAIPAALQGGKNYARWILVQQTTHRVVKAFNHQEPWWFYFKVGPALLVPWLFIPAVWRNVPLLKQWKSDLVQRFLICWIVPVFVIFSVISGKQLHYLLPIWPAVILLIASVWNERTDIQSIDKWAAFTPFVIVGLVWGGLALTLKKDHGPALLYDLFHDSAVYALAYLVCIAACFILAMRQQRLIAPVSLAVVITLIAIHLTAGTSGFTRFTTQPIADALMNYPDRPVAAVASRYQGDFNFTARITQPMTILPPDTQVFVDEFFTQHPRGLMITQIENLEEVKNYHVLATQPARARYLYALVEQR